MTCSRGRFAACLLSLIFLLSGLASSQEENLGFLQLRVNTRLEIPVFQTFFDEKETPYLNFNDLMRAGTVSGVEMGLTLADVPHEPDGVRAALDYLARNRQ